MGFQVTLDIEAIWRFWSFVDQKGPEDCWLWRKQGNKAYGNFSVGKVTLLAHRVSYVIHHGPIPDSLNICHDCDITRCVNPAHLKAATQQVNRQDASSRGRTASGLKHGLCVITPGLADTIRLAKLKYPATSLHDFASQYGLGITTVARILRYDTYLDR